MITFRGVIQKIKQNRLSTSASGCYRKARIPQNLIGEALPTPKEQILFHFILSGQGQLHACQYQLINQSPSCSYHVG
jgi:hypothetical protein